MENSEEATMISTEEESLEEVVDPVEVESESKRSEVTFMGNTFDLTAMGAVAASAMVLFMCGTCNTGYYCIPFFPLILGIIGLITARSAVDSKRTKILSWIGVGTGGLFVILLVFAILLYIGLFIFAIAMGMLEEF